jgi:structure-specific endonuclease subunit SLX1
MSYCVYILRSCDDRRYYKGCTIDLKRRLRQHNGDIKGGARATSCRRPWSIACFVEGMDKIQALSVEWHAKHPCGRRSHVRGGLDAHVAHLRACLDKAGLGHLEICYNRNEVTNSGTSTTDSLSISANRST